jgi:non-canonical (house-cleaning) NTP pyrophosphatase
MKIAFLTSTNPVKINAVESVFNELAVAGLPTKDAPIPPQPINSGQLCATLRAKYIKKDILQPYEFIISIENEIAVSHGKVSDICQVLIEDRWGRVAAGNSFPIDVDAQYYQQAVNRTPSNYPLRELGLSITIGQMISEKYPTIDHQNWMASPLF